MEYGGYALEYMGSIKLSTTCWVSDPCYSADGVCNYLVDGLVEGDWDVYVRYTGGSDNRVAELIVQKAGYSIMPCELLFHDIGVDSGLAGFFDGMYFEENTEDDAWNERVVDSFSDDCVFGDNSKELADVLKGILDKLDNGSEVSKDDVNHLGGLINKIKEPVKSKVPDVILLDNKCCISRTGYGDGTYNLFVGKNRKGLVVSLSICYIDTEEDEDNDYNEYDWDDGDYYEDWDLEDTDEDIEEEDDEHCEII